MGKIVKYCSSCDEGFAEKFAFCPNCASSLQAFEMNPVEAKAAAAKEQMDEPPVTEVLAKAEPAEPVIEEPVQAAPLVDEAILEAPAPEPAKVEEPVIERPAPRTRAVTAPVYAQTTPVDVDRIPTSLTAEHDRAVRDGGFYVTVIEEKNGKQRNVLLVGALGLMLVLLM